MVFTLAMPHKPATGSLWPMLDLTEPMCRGRFLPVQNTSSMVFSSSGSPTLVPATFANGICFFLGFIIAEFYLFHELQRR